MLKEASSSLERLTKFAESAAYATAQSNDFSKIKNKKSKQKQVKNESALRNATLSPPPSSKEGKTATFFSNSKGVAAQTLQKSNKRINYLKSLVRKQQQKSLSRDFNNALIN